MTLLITPERLRAHIVRLVGEIGDRNVFRPAALEAAADYIVGQWRGFGGLRDRLMGAVDYTAGAL